MAPLGLGGGFYSLGPTLNAGEAVHVGDVNKNYLTVPQKAGNGLTLNNPFQSLIRTSFTFSCWFFANPIASGSTGTTSLFGSRVGVAGTDEVRFGVNSNGKIAFYMNVTNGGGHVIDATSASAPFSASTIPAWQHIALTVTDNGGTNNTTYVVYINGSANTMSEGGSGLTGNEQESYNSTKNIFLGALGQADSAVSNDRHVAIVQAAFWGAALNATNIAEIYGGGETGFDLASASGGYDTQGDLAGWWECNNGQGSTADDSTGNNDGTTTGAAVLI